MTDARRIGNRAYTAGFTLPELLAVLALVAILLSLAVPAYRQYGLRIHRGDAIATLLRQAALLERHYREQGQYAGLSGLADQAGPYVIERQLPQDGQAYLLLATPQGPQQHDACGTLLLDHLGGRTVQNENGRDAAWCWAGR